MASTSTKSRRPVNGGGGGVVMSTPPPASRTKSMYSESDKQGLLQNFDLEVADKIKYFRSILDHTLSSFRTREESEILSIPRELRKMTLTQLEEKWGGGWAGTLQRIRRESFEAREKVREELEEKEREEVVKGKRKRNTTATNSSPDRQSKNAKRGLPAPSSALRKSTRTAPGGTRPKPATKKKAISGSGTAPSSSGPSSLPQNHIFNPSLPPTPFRAAPSPLSKPNSSSSFRAGPSRSKLPSTLNTSTSANNRAKTHSRAESSSSRPPSDSEEDADRGSDQDGSGSGSEREDEGAREDGDDRSDVESRSGSASESDDDDDDDLPDPEAMEAKFLSKSQMRPQALGRGGQGQSHPQTPNSKSKSSRKKRGPSLIFRQSLAPGQLPHMQKDRSTAKESGVGGGGGGEGEEPLSTIHLSDGRTISFNPFSLTPGRVDRELEEGGVSRQEKISVQAQVHEEVVRSLRERMERWKV